MYIPASFKEDRTPSLHELIQTHPLGLLVTHGAGGLQASPLPFLLYPGDGEKGLLRAHMARANPHWRELAGLAECLVLFQAENGYVTPSWYPGKASTGRAVPTWNYAVVEVRGEPRVVEDSAWLSRQLADLTARHEGRRPRPWSMDDAPADYIAAQMQAVVGIEIPIRRIDGKWKMSQNRDEADRAGVAAGLADRDDPHFNPGVARRMEDC